MRASRPCWRCCGRIRGSRRPSSEPGRNRPAARTMARLAAVARRAAGAAADRSAPRSERGASILPAMRRQLASVVPEARIDDHHAWLGGLHAAARPIRAVLAIADRRRRGADRGCGGVRRPHGADRPAIRDRVVPPARRRRWRHRLAFRDTRHCGWGCSAARSAPRAALLTVAAASPGRRAGSAAGADRRPGLRIGACGRSRSARR